MRRKRRPLLLRSVLFAVLGLIVISLHAYLTTPASPREFRGVWVASVDNVDWPSQPGLPVAQQKAELLNILNRMQALHLNALIFQVRPTGDALYRSSLEPWSAWLTGQQGVPPQPDYDPLEFAIAESHKRNIELHAWFNPYRAQLRREDGPFAANHIASKYPQYMYQYGEHLWMDPGVKVIQDQTYTVLMDVVRRYDIDAIHIDDYFYPYPRENIPFPDTQTYQAYRAAGGTLSLDDWRRQNVNTFVQRLYTGIHAEKPDVKFGISPFGIYRPGDPPSIKGFDQYEGLYADVKLWLKNGWIDYLAPQLYWRIDPPEQSYPVLLDWWLRHNPHRRHVYAGIAINKVGRPDWSSAEIQRKVSISRQNMTHILHRYKHLSLGNIFFSMRAFRDNLVDINDIFKKHIYPIPALPPEMLWLHHQKLSPPTGITTDKDRISWDPDPTKVARSWALYQRKYLKWELVNILNAETTTTKVSPGTYALRAVDRLAHESKQIVVKIN